MKKQLKRIGLKMMALTLLLPVIFAGAMGAYAEGTEEPASSQNVKIHKMAYENKLPEEVQNDGGIMEDFEGTPLAGAGFTAYDVTNVYWAAYEEATGNHAAKETAAVAAALKADLTGVTPVGEEGVTEADGTADFDDLDIVSGDKNAVYRFVETTMPAGVVASKSADVILGLPVYAEDGELRETVHVYPKNVIEDVDLGFTKYGVDEEGEIAALPGAKFTLKNSAGAYYKEGAFTATADTAGVLTSNENGVVSVDGLLLTPGDYTFTEVDSDVSKAEKQSGVSQGYHYTEAATVIATVTKDMAVTYTYYNVDGEALVNQDSAEAYNFKVPTVNKTADDHKVDRGQVVNYTIETMIPKDIATYTTYQLVDIYSAGLELVSTNEEITDSIKIGGNKVTDLATTDLNTAEKSFTVTFTISELAKYAGETLTLTADMKVITDDLDVIENDVTLKNDFYDQTDKETVETDAKVFLKKDLHTQAALVGAKFVVKNPDGKFLQLLDENGNAVTEVSGYATGYDVNWVADQADATTLISDTNGQVGVYGLAELADGKEYTIVETAAPDGYVTPSDAGIDFTTDKAEEELVINNKAKGFLPSTGGVGIVGFVGIGLLVVAGSVWYFRKRAEA